MWGFVGLHSIFAVVLGRIHAFAPDELNYMNIVREMYQSGFSTQDILGWRNSQLWFLQLAYSPARLLEAVGVPDFLAIRLLAIFLSAVAVYLLMCLLRANPTKLGKYLVGVSLITPSIFLWMTLGLRECFIFFALALICTGVYLLTQKDTRTAFLFLVSGNLVLFETKPLIFLITLAALLLTLIYSVLRSRRLHVRHAVLIASLLIPIVIFPVGAKIMYFTLESQFASVASTGQASIAQYAEQITTEYAEQTTSTSAENAPTTSSVLQTAIDSQPENILVKILKSLGLDKRLSSTEYSDGTATPSQPRSSRLDIVPAKISEPITILLRTGGFLFTPFPFIDNGSFFVNLLALESPAWWLLYGALILAMWRRFATRAVDELTVFILSFSGGFLMYSALTEINVGTLARHRSVLLIPILFLVLSTGKKLVKSRD